MTKIILSGCSGSMGRTVAACAAAHPEQYAITAGIDKPGPESKESAFPVFSDPKRVDREADVLIDFSNPSLLSSLLAFGKERKVPLVLCTTGYSPQQTEAIREASKTVAIFSSGNMSIGINLLIELAKQAARVLGTDFDVEIVEMHHNRKLDAPSGTALMIADGVSEALGEKMQYVYDRHSRRQSREKTEIGIHSLRGGTVVGEHKVVFAGPQEVVTLSHSAQSRDIFATGALHASDFLKSKQAGLYHMSDLLK